MKQRSWVDASWLLVLTMTLSVAAQAEDREGQTFFETRIRPVLVQHCYACHSADAARAGKLKGGLQLDSRAGVLQGGESGPIVTADRPEESLLIAALRHADSAPAMPPDQQLPQTVIDDFIAWIRRGLPDPRTASAVTVSRGMSIEAGRRWWSMVAPERHQPPAAEDPSWPRGPVDHFVFKELEKHGLKPAGDADRATLLRRVWFDLVGLPPPVDELERFLADPSSTALADTVDRLLASTHFGERWARHWLDVVRYSDSNGRDRNILWYHAWRYRDYVIASFNADKPFDQFIREQIAGDLLPAQSREHRDELRTATGFLALGPKAFEEQKPELFRMDLIDEQIDVLGRAFLGLSIGCARCHDHKFDPIPTRDYYALAGIFRRTQTLYGHGPRGIKATQHHHTELIPVGPDADSLGAAGLAYFARLHELNLIQNTARSDRYRVVRRLADARNRLQAPDADVAALQAEIARMEAEIKDWDLKVKEAETIFQAAQDAAPPLPGWAMGAQERSESEDCRIHIRGDTTNLGDVVPRGVLQVLPHSFPHLPDSHSGRLELAEWLATTENPLVARVFVNRVWQHLFGRGLVTTPDDFGVNGALPSHPQLLDDLSVRFMQQGWSTKRLIRELVTSRSYQMASTPDARGIEVDPDNRLLWRMAPRQIEVEPFRDAVLTVSDQLDRNPPAERQPFLARLHPHRDPEFTNFKPQFLPQEIDHPYRSVYLPVVRGVLPPIFQLFDFAAPDRSVSARDVSTVPAQTLFLMNNPWIIDQSQKAAKRVLSDPRLADDQQRVQRLFQWAFARRPDSEELQATLDYLAVADLPRTAADERLAVASENKLADGSPPREKTSGENTAEDGTGHAAELAKRRETRWASFCQILFASAEFRTLK
jgi:cytochrome c553